MKWCKNHKLLFAVWILLLVPIFWVLQVLEDRFWDWGELFTMSNILCLGAVLILMGGWYVFYFYVADPQERNERKEGETPEQEN